MQALYTKILNVIILIALYLLVYRSILYKITNEKVHDYLKYIYIFTTLLILKHHFGCFLYFNLSCNFMLIDFFQDTILYLMIINLIFISYIDIKSFKIPNLLLIMDCVIFICMNSVITSDMEMFYRYCFASSALIIGFIINWFWNDKIGFGDIKMIAASFLWIEPKFLGVFIFLIGLFGLITWHIILRKMKINIRSEKAKSVQIPLALAIALARIVCMI